MKRLLLAVGLCVTLTAHAALFPQGFTTNSFLNGFGPISPTTILAIPTPFTIPASDWNPIVVAGFGTTGANGNYYRLITNSGTANVGYGIWTNGAGSDFIIIFNDTNFVPSLLASNSWTLQNRASDRIYYYNFSRFPFATWDNTELVGTPGALPIGMVGSTKPPLITASDTASADGLNLVLNPGIYDIGGYIWRPTNLTVVGYGARVLGDAGNIFQMEPYGMFTAFGLAVSNNNPLAPLMRPEHVVSNMTLVDVDFYGHANAIRGQFLDNANLTVIGGRFGSASGGVFNLTTGTNTVHNNIGVTLWARTNWVTSASFPATINLLDSDLSVVNVTGCLIDMGSGFTNSSGIIVRAGSTYNISGTQILEASGNFKIIQTAGAVNIGGHPYPSTSISGAVIFNGPSVIRTNFVGGQLYTNNYGIPIQVSCTISNVIANAAGASRTALWIYPQTGSGITGTTNFAGDYHQAQGATVIYTNLVSLAGIVPTNLVFTFTNQSSGSGNDSKTVNGGQIWIP